MHQYIIDNQMYLDFFEISIDEIPFKGNDLDKGGLFKLIENKFRILARKYHPDYGGSKEDFIKLVNYKQKLISDDGELSNFLIQFDENKYQQYDPSTLAAGLGNQLFDLISSWSEELNIKPIYKPNNLGDEYEWVFIVKNDDIKISLNVQNLSASMLELSNSLYAEDSLPVLVCLFIPSKKLAVNKMSYDNSIQLTFDDTVLIETSSLKTIKNYFENHNQLKEDIEKIKNNTFVSKPNLVLKTKTEKELTEKDKEVLDYLSTYKLFKTNYNEHAADFLDKL